MSESKAGLWDSLRENALQWLPEKGYGWYPVTAQPYGDGYWARYRLMDRTEAGAELTRARCALIARHPPLGRLVDVGIGGGRFVVASGAFGYDVNPAAIDWLKTRGLWHDVTAEDVTAATFWDSLEHIPEPRQLLSNVRGYVYASLPIFDGPKHVLSSKHFRKDEHCWYFTSSGFEGFMADLGFALIERNEMEQAIGRQDIQTFVFKRVDG